MSTNIAVQRVQRELTEIIRSEEIGRTIISIETVNNSMVDLEAKILGPPDTPYENGVYQLEIKIPDTYPFNPPKVRFMTKIWHPNISSATGAICLDILKDQWAAAMTIRTVLLSLQALLSTPEPDDPQDAVVARQYKESQHLFVLTAKHWTAEYAWPADPNQPAKYQNAEFESKIQQLVEVMRIAQHEARVALSSNNWDVQRATQSLL